MSAAPVATLTTQQYDSILDAVSDAVLITDAERHITALNRQAQVLGGLRREEALGRQCSDVRPRVDGDRDCPLTTALREERSITQQLEIITPHRGLVRLDVTALPLRNEAGVIVGGAVICRLAPTKLAATSPDQATPEASAADASDTEDLSILDATERQAIERVLRENGWNQGLACRTLGISRTTLWRKMKKLNISVPRRGTGR